MGMSEKELAQRLFIEVFAKVDLAVNKGEVKLPPGMSGVEFIEDMSKSCVKAAAIFEAAYLDTQKKKATLEYVEQSQFEQFLQMLRTAKVSFEEPVTYGDGTKGVKVFIGYDYFPTFYFSQKTGRLEEVF